MANSKLQMPANYMALNESEMSCVEGGGIISQVCYAFGRMFRSTYYDKWESEYCLLYVPDRNADSKAGCNGGLGYGHQSRYSKFFIS